MNIILILVGVLSAYLAYISNGNYTKTIVVLLIVAINVFVSIFQENRAENALAALKSFPHQHQLFFVLENAKLFLQVN